MQIKTNEEKMMDNVMESCFFKSFMSCVLGYGLGAAIGLFSASVNPSITTEPGMAHVERVQTAREIFKEMRQTTHSYGKNFAVIGKRLISIAESWFLTSFNVFSRRRFCRR